LKIQQICVREFYLLAEQNIIVKIKLKAIKLLQNLMWELVQTHKMECANIRKSTTWKICVHEYTLRNRNEHFPPTNANAITFTFTCRNIWKYVRENPLINKLHFQCISKISFSTFQYSDVVKLCIYAIRR
jgi:hypothetical protein